jgi:hypothetical protein
MMWVADFGKEHGGTGVGSVLLGSAPVGFVIGTVTAVDLYGDSVTFSAAQSAFFTGKHRQFVKTIITSIHSLLKDIKADREARHHALLD